MADLETVDEYIERLPVERQAVVSAVRDVVLANLPEGFAEEMGFGMITWVVPLADYPVTYNGRPLMYAALASQKNYISLYLMNVYGNPEIEGWFTEGFRERGKRLNMGKSCVRFRTLDDLPMDLIGEVIARTSPAEWIATYEASRAGLVQSRRRRKSG